MHGFALTFALISTVVPASATTVSGTSRLAIGTSEQVAQTSPTSPPPAAEIAPPPTTTAAPTPAPGWGAAPPEGAAPALRGLSAWGVIPAGYSAYGYGLGVGASFIMPLWFPPIIKHGRFHDIWAVEGGADLWHFSFDECAGIFSNCPSYSENWLVPFVNVMWQLWLSDDFAVYPHAGLAVPLVVSGGCSGYCSNPFPLRPNVGAGLIYRIGSNLILRAEIGYEGIKGGIGFVL